MNQQRRGQCVITTRKVKTLPSAQATGIVTTTTVSTQNDNNENIINKGEDNTNKNSKTLT